MEMNKWVVVACLDECVVALLDKHNKDNFDVDIRNSPADCFWIFYPHTHTHTHTYTHTHTHLGYLIEVTLGGKYIFHHFISSKVSGMRPISTSFMTTNRKNPTIYQIQLDYGRKWVCYEIYIHLSHHHQHFFYDG